MTCDLCHLDKTITVVTSIKLNRIDTRSGREHTEIRTTRLCLACGGADDPVTT